MPLHPYREDGDVKLETVREGELTHRAAAMIWMASHRFLWAPLFWGSSSTVPKIWPFTSRTVTAHTSKSQGESELGYRNLVRAFSLLA